MLDPSNFRLFWSKNLRYAAFNTLIASHNSRPELLSLGRNLKKYKKNFYCPNTYLAFCLINLSSTERVQALKLSRFRSQKLWSRRELITVLLFSYDFHLERRILFKVLHL